MAQGTRRVGKVPDTPCSVCGKLLYSSATSLPPGQITCRPCRRARRVVIPTRVNEVKTCLVCGTTFIHRRRLRYCSGECFQRAHGGRPKPKKRLHYQGSYAQQAKAVTTAAYADSETRCWRCGLTLAEHPNHKNGASPIWHAGHVVDGEVGGELRAEGSTCNVSHGAALGARRAPLVNNLPRWSRVYRRSHETVYCGWCGVQLTVLQAKYCSRRCSAWGRSTKTSMPMPWRQCGTCGGHFVSRQPKGYCSEVCNPWRSGPLVLTVQCACGREFTYTRRGAPRKKCDDCRQASPHRPRRSERESA